MTDGAFCIKFKKDTDMTKWCTNCSIAIDNEECDKKYTNEQIYNLTKEIIKDFFNNWKNL